MLKPLLTLTCALLIAPNLVTQQKTEPDCCISDTARLSAQKIKALLDHIEPIPPLLGDKVRIKGKMVLEIAVDASGEVVCVKPTSGHPLMIGVTIDSVRRWRFHPLTVNGVKKEFCGQLTLDFEASEYGVKYKVT